MDAKPNGGLRGKSQAEKRRIGRLSRSERVIEDPEDRTAVAAFSAYMVWFYEQKAKRNRRGLLDWAVLSLFVLGTVVLFASGLPPLGGFLAVLAACFLSARWLSRRWKRQLLRTAEINGWS